MNPAISSIPGLAWPGKGPLDGPHASSGSPPSSVSTHDGAGPAAADPAAVNVLPPSTRVRITGNNRTAHRLLGMEAIVKRANGLGGWHFLTVVPNGEEIKLQRNALHVIEMGPAEESQESSEDDEPQLRDLPPSQPEILDRPRIRRRPRSLSPVPEIFKRPSTGSPSGSGRSSTSSKAAFVPMFAPAESLDLCKLETASLRRYRRVHQLDDVDPSAPKDELASAVNRHFRNQLVIDESGVLLAFCAALRRRSSAGGC